MQLISFSNMSATPPYIQYTINNSLEFTNNCILHQHSGNLIKILPFNGIFIVGYGNFICKIEFFLSRVCPYDPMSNLL